MKLKGMVIGLLLGSSLLALTNVAAARNPPVAKLVQVHGAVEYSRNGKTWRPVRRTKYLFSGYKIRTGKDGRGKLINQKSGMAQKLGPNSEITVNDCPDDALQECSNISLVSGSLSKPKEESSSIFQGLANKFAKAQRYTTVRRSITTSDDKICDSKVRTIREITLSPSHPDLVWRNACPEYSYRLLIDGVAHEIVARSNAEMIRYSVAGVTAGVHSFRVEVLDNDGTVYIPRKDSKFVWIDNKAEKKILANLKQYSDDVFLRTNLLESENMHVAAMDAYREYFTDNPDDNDMRPLLIQSYQELKLSDLRENEARLYNASLVDDY